jgi:hypothetical protein
LLAKRAFVLLNAVFAIANLDFISCVHLASFVIMLPKYLKYSTFSICLWFVVTITNMQYYITLRVSIITSVCVCMVIILRCVRIFIHDKTGWLTNGAFLETRKEAVVVAWFKAISCNLRGQADQDRAWPMRTTDDPAESQNR